MNFKLLQKWGLILLGLIIYIIVVKVLWAYDSETFPVKTYLVVGSILLFIILLFIYYFTNRNKNDEENSPFTVPKDIVNSEPLKKILIEELIKKTNIPYYIKYIDGEELIKPFEKNAIKILDCKPISNKKTPNQYYGVVVQILEGDLRGIHTIYVPKDMGLKGVRENCMMYVERFTTFRTSDPNPNDWDNVNSHNQIIELARLRAEQEGAEDYEIDALRSMRLANIPDPVVVKKQNNTKKKEIKNNDEEKQSIGNFYSAQDYERDNEIGGNDNE